MFWVLENLREKIKWKNSKKEKLKKKIDLKLINNFYV